MFNATNPPPDRGGGLSRPPRFIPTVRTIDRSRRPRRIIARPRAGHRGRYTIARVGTIGRGKRLSFNRRAAPDGPIESGHDVGERPRQESVVRPVGITKA